MIATVYVLSWMMRSIKLRTKYRVLDAYFCTVVHSLSFVCSTVLQNFQSQDIEESQSLKGSAISQHTNPSDTRLG